MIVLDTNVVSELMRSARDRRVEAWARGLTVETALLTAIGAPLPEEASAERR